jgi:ElaB/YqjD/DUF883 family membrane-anchored ribosome-binding protein
MDARWLLRAHHPATIETPSIDAFCYTLPLRSLIGSRFGFGQSPVNIRYWHGHCIRSGTLFDRRRVAGRVPARSAENDIQLGEEEMSTHTSNTGGSSSGAMGQQGRGQDRTGDLKQSMTDTAQSVRDTASQAMEAVKGTASQAREMATQQYETARDTASEYWEQGRARAVELERTLEHQIAQAPIKSVAMAAAVGFVLGIFWIRR